MQLTSRRTLVPIAAFAALALAACSSGGSTGTTAASTSTVSGAPALDTSVTLVLYNAQHDTLTAAWVAGFTAQTGIKVDIRKGSDLTMANQIVAEGSASPADVFLTENSPGMSLVDNAGLLAPIEKSTLDQVPTNFQASNGKWVGIAARSTVMAYNPSMITEAQLPKSIMDLQDSAWNGKWGAAPQGADFQAIVSAMLELKGESATASWLKALKSNGQAFSGNSAAMKAVNAGTVASAIIYHYYWFGDQAKTKENSANVKLHYFGNQDPGAFLSVSGGGVLGSSKHPNEAQALVNYITSKAGQAILKDGNSFEYAVGKDCPSNPALTPIAQLDAPKIDPAKLNSPKVVSLMTTAGLI